jgi:hypothetical protein
MKIRIILKSGTVQEFKVDDYIETMSTLLEGMNKTRDGTTGNYERRESKSVVAVIRIEDISMVLLVK